MRVALTGTSGFTGRFVARELERRGIDCVPLEVELTDAAAVARAVEALPFDRLIHLAGHAFVNAADWEGFYTVNQLGTLHLLDAVARVRPGTRCIVASSAQVYGTGAEGMIAEDAPVCPSNHYSNGKLAMEGGAALWRDRIDVIVTRPFNYTGVGQDLAFLVPKIVDHYRRRAPVIELGNTWVRRDFGDVRSVAEAYVGLILADAPPTPVNIATGTVWSIANILERLTAISGHRIEVRINPAFVRPNDAAVLGGSVERLRAALPDWQPRALSDTLEWMLTSG